MGARRAPVRRCRAPASGSHRSVRDDGSFAQQGCYFEFALDVPAREAGLRWSGFGALVPASGFCAATFSSDRRFVSRFSVRRQAAAHWPLVMCVWASQKPMHAATPAPPPPGALGADSLALPVVARDGPPPPGKVVTVPPEVGDVTPLRTPEGVVDGVRPSPSGVVEGADPPPVSVVGGLALPPLRKFELGGGESGATCGTCGAGVPMAEGALAPGLAAGPDGAPVDGDVDSPPPRPPGDAPAPDDAPELAPPPPPRLWAAASCCRAPAMRRAAAAARHDARGSGILTSVPGSTRMVNAVGARELPAAAASHLCALPFTRSPRSCGVTAGATIQG
jgi:hypothetical protein